MGINFSLRALQLWLFILVCSVHTSKWRVTFLFTTWESLTLSLAVTCNCSKNNILRALCWSAGFEHQPLNLQSLYLPPADKHTLFCYPIKAQEASLDLHRFCHQLHTWNWMQNWLANHAKGEGRWNSSVPPSMSQGTFCPGLWLTQLCCRQGAVQGLAVRAKEGMCSPKCYFL